MKGHLCRLLVVLILVAGTASAAAAQGGVDPTSLTLEDLMATPVERVYGASKFLQKVSDAPAAVTIITAEEIRLYGYRTLADVLRAVEGISISYDRNYTYLGMRGLSRPGDLNSRVLVMIDGHRMNNNVDGQAPIGTDFQMDVDLIDRVEVIRGPSAALYGSTAFAAVVAVVTRPGAKVNGWEAAASAGSFGTTRARATWGRRTPAGLDVLVSATTLRADGPSHLQFPEFAAEGTTGGVAAHRDGDRADGVTATAGYGGLKLLGLYSLRTKQIPTASFNTVFDSGREQTTDGRVLFDAQYAHELGRSANLLVRGYTDRHRYDGYYPYPAEDADALVINRDHFRGVSWGTELDLSRRLGRGHTLTGGVEVRHNPRQSTLNYDEDPMTVYIDQRPHTATAALTVQDEWLIHRRLRLNLAGRAERLPSGEIGAGPKIAAIFLPGSATTVKVLFNRALRPPTIYELYYDSPANAGNPDLDPEEMESLELNVEHYLSPVMKVSASLYRNVYRDLIIDVADEAGTVGLRNGLDARVPGLELGWSMHRRSGVEARASYTQQFDADAASVAWTSGAPKHLAKLSAGHTSVPGHFAIGGELQYESRRRTHAGDVLPPAVIANLSVTRPDVRRGVDLRVGVYNLLDARYSEPVSENHRQGAILQDGRQLVAGLTWRFR